ncbi:MAG: ATPase [Rhodoferax sp.]|nr:MAG: ATPase [Rhodoferax sp.]
MAAQVIALVGAECTGKSTLAQALQTALSARGLRVTWVPEVLRDWCQQHQRTPQAHEQAAIANAQAQAIDAARADCDWVFADTTPLNTALYSELLFGDRSLYPMALEFAQRCALHLLCATDLPWVADGLQRDGEAARLTYDTRLRAVLSQHQIAYATLLGQGEVRTQRALRHLEATLWATPPAAYATQTPWKWGCERCSDARCEHLLFSALVNKDR